MVLDRSVLEIRKVQVFQITDLEHQAEARSLYLTANLPQSPISEMPARLHWS